MTRTSKSIKCSLPNDHEINIIRQQVNVLPNFSMTDYASQGKTRPYNVVNLSHCKNFQSIYTCLSRSSSAAGTLIIQGFNSVKITRGLSGHLRQEFRELNILDEITMKIYEGHISTSYVEPLRNPMIYKYQTKFQIKNETNTVIHRLMTHHPPMIHFCYINNFLKNIYFYMKQFFLKTSTSFLSIVKS